MSYLKIRLKPFALTKAEHRGDDTQEIMFVGQPSDLPKLHTAVLVELYNALDGGTEKRPVKKFADRATAERRTWSVLRPTLETLTGVTQPEELPMATATADKKSTKVSKKTAANGNGARARGFAPDASITKLVEEDGRRDGTPGAKSFKLIKDGMTVEQFVAKGGRLRDLRWDIAKKHVKVG